MIWFDLFGCIPQVTASCGGYVHTNAGPDAAKWVELAGCWLEKRFALPLSEKSKFEEMLEKGLI